MEPIKILLIDDEQSMYDIVTHYCKKNKEYAINLEWYNQVPKESSQILNQDFNLLLLDYHINQNTGIDVLNMLNKEHEQEYTSHLPIIMLTSSDDINVAAQAIHKGISDFIPKSKLSAELLNSTINDVIYKNNLKLELIKTNKELRQKNEEISNFYQVISHELKTPLTSIIAFISLMLNGNAGAMTDDQKEYLSICKNNCMQLTLYINDLLDVARISTNRLKINKTKSDLNAVAIEAIRTSQILADVKKINLKLEHSEPAFWLNVDNARIYQALLILLNNAIKFSHEYKDIVIQLSRDSTTKDVLISVIDHGTGIAKEHHQKIFERLFQTNTHDTTQSGLGLGLFICNEIVQLHHGTISVESELYKGSKFTIRLPSTENTIQ